MLVVLVAAVFDKTALLEGSTPAQLPAVVAGQPPPKPACRFDQLALLVARLEHRMRHLDLRMSTAKTIDQTAVYNSLLTELKASQSGGLLPQEWPILITDWELVASGGLATI